MTFCLQRIGPVGFACPALATALGLWVGGLSPAHAVTLDPGDAGVIWTVDGFRPADGIDLYSGKFDLSYLPTANVYSADPSPLPTFLIIGAIGALVFLMLDGGGDNPRHSEPEPTPVPLPATVWLLAAAVGLLCLKRK